MLSIDDTLGARALMRNGAQLARRVRNGVASLRPATIDAVIISIFCATLFLVSTSTTWRPDCLSSLSIIEIGR